MAFALSTGRLANTAINKPITVIANMDTIEKPQCILNTPLNKFLENPYPIAQLSSTPNTPAVKPNAPNSIARFLYKKDFSM